MDECSAHLERRMEPLGTVAALLIRLIEQSSWGEPVTASAPT